MARRHLCALAALALLAAPRAGAEAPGQALYEKNCAQCHGDKGDGRGPAAPHLRPKPRDFTAGKFKIRTTPSGALPTDDDLRHIIRRGMPYSSMPAWPQFTDAEVSQLVEYVKSFDADFKDAAKAPKKVDLPARAPAFSAESAAKGAKIYASLGCTGCHGEAGRGDGPSAPSLKDDLGNPIRPANLSQAWTFRGGAAREDIFRTLSTGLNGTPMPSFHDALKDDERWQLTDYIASLGGSETPGYGTLVVASPVEETVDLASAPALLAKAPVVRFPVAGQIMEPGRAFYPAATSVLVRAVYDDRRIAFQVSWDDTHADTSGHNAPDLAVPVAEEEDEPAPAAAPAGGDDVWGADAAPAAPAAPAGDVWGEETPAPAAPAFTDAVALQWPAALTPPPAKPYFLFGDSGNPVDLWFLDTGANRVRQYLGRGSASLSAVEGGGEVEGKAAFEKGTWSAVFVRDLRSSSGVSFTEDQFVPVAFSVWDGLARERGNRRGLTEWFYVYLPPRERPSPVVPMAVAAGITVVLEILVVAGMRRRRPRAAPAPQA